MQLCLGHRGQIPLLRISMHLRGEKTDSCHQVETISRWILIAGGHGTPQAITSSKLNRSTSERDSCPGTSWEERLVAQKTASSLVRASVLWPGEHERSRAWPCEARSSPGDSTRRGCISLAELLTRGHPTDSEGGRLTTGHGACVLRSPCPQQVPAAVARARHEDTRCPSTLEPREYHGPSPWRSGACSNIQAGGISQMNTGECSHGQTENSGAQGADHSGHKHRKANIGLRRGFRLPQLVTMQVTEGSLDHGASIHTLVPTMPQLRCLRPRGEAWAPRLTGTWPSRGLQPCAPCPFSRSPQQKPGGKI
ncbi:hypothetical protein PAL_GLEAN10000510 [Pteropus alecto]|uniref:Uncharacterized protein n=1 Tax=Pteropus alecto TaxID=9402 RepID=L5L3V8_PTEAL|nr:hypothetical protein PAL_GLEAN10000510 [Pteropus alecto]